MQALKGACGIEGFTVCTGEAEVMEVLPLEQLDRSDPPLLCEEKRKLRELIVSHHHSDDDDGHEHNACNLLLTQQ